MSEQGGLSPLPLRRRRPSQPQQPPAPVVAADGSPDISATLSAILSQLTGLKDGQERIEKDVSGLKEGQEKLERGQERIEGRLDALEASHQTLLTGQQRLHERLDAVEAKLNAVGNDTENLVAGQSTLASRMAVITFSFEEERDKAIKAGEGETGRLVPLTQVRAACADVFALCFDTRNDFLNAQKTILGKLEGHVGEKLRAVDKKVQADVDEKVRVAVEAEVAKKGRLEAPKAPTPRSSLEGDAASAGTSEIYSLYSETFSNPSRAPAAASRSSVQSSHTFGRPHQRSETPPAPISTHG